MFLGFGFDVLGFFIFLFLLVSFGIFTCGFLMSGVEGCACCFYGKGGSVVPKQGSSSGVQKAHNTQS